jgi:AraC-like DNA-binding protein
MEDQPFHMDYFPAAWQHRVDEQWRQPCEARGEERRIRAPAHCGIAAFGSGAGAAASIDERGYPNGCRALSTGGGASARTSDGGGPGDIHLLRELDIAIESPVVSVGVHPQLIALFEELLDVVAHGYNTLQLLHASQVLAHLMAVMIRDHRNTPQQQPGTQQKIAQTIAYMRQHLNQSLQLDALAAVANLSRSRYADLFKKQTGYAPMDYFIRMRMHRACQFLDNTDLNIKTVAAELGYEDPLYFTRVFRAVVELAPTAYRLLRKGQPTPLCKRNRQQHSRGEPLKKRSFHSGSLRLVNNPMHLPLLPTAQ